MFRLLDTNYRIHNPFDTEINFFLYYTEVKFLSLFGQNLWINRMEWQRPDFWADCTLVTLIDLQRH